MTAHTPGPWHTIDSRAEAAAVGVENDSGWVGIGDSDGYLGSMYMKSEEQNLINARLAAAAPDLLAVANEQLALINHAQAILTAHLVPDGMGADEAINQLLGLLDGPDQRRVAAMYSAALAKAVQS